MGWTPVAEEESWESEEEPGGSGASGAGAEAEAEAEEGADFRDQGDSGFGCPKKELLEIS